MATQDDLTRLPWPRQTRRLSLRPFGPDDTEATWNYRRLDVVNRWITAAPATFAIHCEQALDPVRMAGVLVVEHDGVVIGDVGLRIEDAWSQLEVREQARGVQGELGWCLDPAYAGRGFATEAVEELLRIAFDDLRLRRVVAGAFADNAASLKLMERIGMRREQLSVRESLHRSGEWLDGVTYALLADEWRSRRPV